MKTTLPVIAAGIALAALTGLGVAGCQSNTAEQPTAPETAATATTSTPSPAPATPETSTAASNDAAVQKATITVDAGYSPDSITLTAGKPAELTFIRKSTEGCDGELVFPSLGIRKTLKTGEKTVVSFTPKESGTVNFACGMDMYKGKVIVQ